MQKIDRTKTPDSKAINKMEFHYITLMQVNKNLFKLMLYFLRVIGIKKNI